MKTKQDYYDDEVFELPLWEEISEQCTRRQAVKRIQGSTQEASTFLACPSCEALEQFAADLGDRDLEDGHTASAREAKASDAILSGALALAFRRAKLPPGRERMDFRGCVRRQLLFARLLPHLAPTVAPTVLGNLPRVLLENISVDEPLWYVVDCVIVRRMKTDEDKNPTRGSGKRTDELWFHFWSTYRRTSQDCPKVNDPTADPSSVHPFSRQTSGAPSPLPIGGWRQRAKEEDHEGSDDSDLDFVVACAVSGRTVARRESLAKAQGGSTDRRRSTVDQHAVDPRRSAAGLPEVAKVMTPSETARIFREWQCFTGYDDYKKKRASFQVPKAVPVPANETYRPGLSLSRLPDAQSKGVPTLKGFARVAEMGQAIEQMHKEADTSSPKRWKVPVREYMTARNARNLQGTLANAEPQPSMLTPRPARSLPKAAFRCPWERPARKRTEEDDSGQDLSGHKKHASSTVQEEPLEMFAETCSVAKVHPHTESVQFYLRDSAGGLLMREAAFGDHDMLALAISLPKVESLEVVDISGNCRLTDVGAAALLEALAAHHSRHLHILRLDRCANLGRRTILMCTRFLRTAFQELVSLDMSGVSIGMREYVGLGEAIEIHPHLRNLRLADTGLGVSDNTASTVLRALLSNPHLESLELGWNTLGLLALEVLGNTVAEETNLRELGLANTVHGEGLLLFLERLAGDATLTSLDISMNALIGGAPLVIEYAFRNHPQIQSLNVSRNNLGLNGCRALLRLLASPTCPALREILMAECSSGGEGSAPIASMQLFSEDPTGRYVMDLARPVQRAILRLFLTRLLERARGSSTSTYVRNATLFGNEEEKRFAVDKLKRRPNGVWVIPTQGELTFDLDLGALVVQSEDLSCSATVFIQRTLSRNRIALKSFVKVLAVFSLVKQVVDEKLRAELLEALSFDFLLSAEQVTALCRSWLKRNTSTDPVETCSLVMPCLLDPVEAHQRLLELHEVSDRLNCSQSAYDLLSLDVEHPTGHYDLSLSNPPERAAAERLLLVGRWQSQLWKAARFLDVSQRGDGRCTRNEQYQYHDWVWSGDENLLPFFGDFSLDFSALTRPPKDAKTVSDAAWTQIVELLRCVIFPPQDEELQAEQDVDVARMGSEESHGQRKWIRSVYNFDEEHQEEQEELEGIVRPRATKPAEMQTSQPRVVVPDLSHPGLVESDIWSPEESCLRKRMDTATGDIMLVLRSLSSAIWLRCRQLRDLLSLFHNKQQRRTILGMWFLRCVDWPINGKVCRPKLYEDWDDFQKQFGYLSLFFYGQPEHMELTLDLASQEQRRLLHTLIKLSGVENPGGGNLRGAKVDFDWDGSSPLKLEPFMAGVPASWDTWESIPTRGMVQLTYTCSLDDVKLRARRRIASSVAGWSCLPEEASELSKTVQWWSVLDDVPGEVVCLVVFVFTCIGSLEEAWEALDQKREKKLNHADFVGRLKIISRGSLTKRRVILGLDGRRGMAKAQPHPHPHPHPHAPAEEGGGKQEAEDAEETLTVAYRFMVGPGQNKPQATRGDFLHLEKVWRELRTSVIEFRQHMIAGFTSLLNAWDSAPWKNVKGDELDWHAFEYLAKHTGFSGSIRSIFLYLDRNGSESISIVEWMQLNEAGQEPIVAHAAAAPRVKLDSTGRGRNSSVGGVAYA